MAARRPIDADITTYDRETFIHDVWDYGPGDHVTVLAPTGGGKTQLAYQLLGATAKPNLQATIFVMKPRDETVSKFTAQYNFKIIRDWPPPRLPLFDKKPPGYVLWPKETGDPDADDARQEKIFRSALRNLYRKGHKIAFADETYSLEKELGMEKELRRLWTKGRSMDTGLWAASQRPVWISRWAFQAQHLFLGNDPDVDMQKRYGEIGGGIDPDIVRSVTGRLKRYEFVYIAREERTMCVVSAS